MSVSVSVSMSVRGGRWVGGGLVWFGMCRCAVDIKSVYEVS